MEAVGAVAAALQLLDCASKSVYLVLHYGRKTSQARLERARIVDEMMKFSGVLVRAINNLQTVDPLAQEGDQLRSLRAILDGERSGVRELTEDMQATVNKLSANAEETGFKSFWLKLIWPLKEEEVNVTLHKMKVFQGLIDSALASDTNETVRIIAKNQKEEQERQQRKAEEELRQRTVQSYLTWLKHPDPLEIFSSAANKILPDTQSGNWLLDLEEYQKFKDSPRSMFWIRGGEGSGKTVLSTVIVKDIQAQCRSDPKTALAFWYFSAKEVRTRSIDNMLRAFISQLIQHHKSRFPSALEELRNKYALGNSIDSSVISAGSAELVQVLRHLLIDNSTNSYFIIIDALNESDPEASSELSNVYKVLASAFTLASVQLHLLVTSTSEPESDLQKLPFFSQIEIEQHTAHDVEALISYRLQDDMVFKNWPKDQQDHVRKALAMADQNFRWVNQSLNDLRQHTMTPANLDSKIALLPRNNTQRYEMEIRRIDAFSAKYSLALLQWLAYPQRKLRLEDAVEALAVDLHSDPPRFDQSKRMFSGKLLDLCGNLVEVEENTTGYDHFGATAKVTTLSLSQTDVLTFLESKPVRVENLEVIFRKPAVSLRMAETCLTYLDYIIKNVDLTEQNLSQYPFARYAAENWDDCYREATLDKALDMTRLNGMALKLLLDKKSMLTYVRLCNPEKDTQRSDFNITAEKISPPLYYAALHGLTDVVEQLIDIGADVNTYTENLYGTPLVAAAAKGRVDIIQILLDHGADPNKPGTAWWGTPIAVAVEQNAKRVVEILLQCGKVDVNHLRTPRARINEQPLEYTSYDRRNTIGTLKPAIKESLVYIAADNKSTETLELLMDHDADPNIEGGECHTALIAACVLGSEEMVGALLKNGARVDIYGGVYGSALEAACFAANSAGIIRKLLEKGIDVNHKDPSGKTALYVAVEQGNAEYVAVLLERNDIDLNHSAGYLGSALHAACYGGHADILQQLLRVGFDKDLLSGRYGTPLCAAAAGKQATIVSKLLDRGADPNLTGFRDQDTALQYAALSGDKVMVKNLLDYHADYTIESGSYGNALMAAIESGSFGVVKLLLDAGIPVNKRTSGPCSYPLLLAAEKGSAEIVRLLFEREANVAVQDTPKPGYTYDTVTTLQKTNNRTVAKMLLKHGADVNEQGGELGTALNAAVNRSSLEMVRLLLHENVDVNVVLNAMGETALMTAANRGNQEIVECLIDRRADLTARDVRGWDALVVAIRSGTLETVRNLLDHGCQPIVGDIRGMSALHYASVSGNNDILELILGFDLDINARDSNGWTCLHWAGASGVTNVKLIKTLLRNGADPSLRDAQDRTPWNLAIACGKEVEAAALSSHIDQLDDSNEERDGEKRSAWGADSCKTCQDSRGNRYKCQRCIDYNLCFRCFMDKNLVHYNNHDFKLTLKDEPHLPVTKGLSINSRVNTNKTPEIGSVAETPLEERWLNSRFDAELETQPDLSTYTINHEAGADLHASAYQQRYQSHDAMHEQNYPPPPPYEQTMQHQYQYIQSSTPQEPLATIPNEAPALIAHHHTFPRPEPGQDQHWWPQNSFNQAPAQFGMPIPQISPVPSPEPATSPFLPASDSGNDNHPAYQRPVYRPQASYDHQNFHFHRHRSVPTFTPPAASAGLGLRPAYTLPPNGHPSGTNSGPPSGYSSPLLEQGQNHRHSYVAYSPHTAPFPQQASPYQEREGYFPNS